MTAMVEQEHQFKVGTAVAPDAVRFQAPTADLGGSAATLTALVRDPVVSPTRLHGFGRSVECVLVRPEG